MHFININKHTIAKNTKHGTNDPPIRVSNTKTGKAEYCSELEILDKNGEVVAKILYNPHQPILKCGARLVIVAEHECNFK